MSGCFSSTSIYKNEYEANDSTFVKRDEGADVYITMESGKNYSGELLVINDSIMFVSSDFGLSDEELADSANQIYIFQNDSIKSIWIQGSSNLLIGLGVGIAVGIPLIEAAGPKEGESWGDFTMGGIGILCIPVGLIIGAATSTYDERVYSYKNREDFNFSQLNIFSRYGAVEPEFLKKIK